MNNTIKLTIVLSDEDRARLDALREAIEALAGAPRPEPELAKAPAPKQEAPAPQEPAAPAEDAPAPEKQPEAPTLEKQPEPTPAPQEPEAAPEVTTAELQSKVVQLVGAGKKDEARAIVQEYAKSVSEVPADKRAEVFKRLSALEG